MGVAANYTSTHSNNVEFRSLVLTAEVNGSAFRSWGLALEIHSVTCDGKLLSPARIAGLSREDGSVFPGVVSNVQYVCTAEDLLVYEWKDGIRQDGGFLRYDIPKKAKIIELRYRLHTRDGKSSDLNVLTSYEFSSLSEEKR